MWRCGIWRKEGKKEKKKKRRCERGGLVGRQRYVGPPRASRVLCGEKDATCQRLTRAAERLHISLSASATSYLYCNANPGPVPDGAFPASWLQRNMIIYPRHFSSLNAPSLRLLLPSFFFSCQQFKVSAVWCTSTKRRQRTDDTDDTFGGRIWRGMVAERLVENRRKISLSA